MRLDAPSATPRRRYDLIDVARGAALAAMVVYHFTWDLGLFGFVPSDTATTGGWKLFARAIAGSFLMLVGFSLVLAHRAGLRPRPFLRRLALVAGAAAAITLATLVATPERFIFFGILHNIALSSVLGLAFLPLPALAVLAAAVMAFALPVLVALPLFDLPLLQWVGLGTATPPTNDYVPVFPWFGAVLTGIAAAKLVLSAAPEGAWTRWRAAARLSRLAAWSGRNSLAIYLLHQPVMIGALYLAVAAGLSPVPAGGQADFAGSCAAACEETGEAAGTCARACACTAKGLRREGLWEEMLAGTLDEGGRLRLSEIAGHCRAGN